MQIIVDKWIYLWYNSSSKQYIARGRSSAGRALEWHSRGHRFDPDRLHQKSRFRKRMGFYFLLLHSSLPIHFSLFLTVDFRKIIRYTVKTEERYFFRTSVFILLIFREGKNKNCARIVSEAVCFGQLVSVLSRQRTTHIFRRTLCR